MYEVINRLNDILDGNTASRTVRSDAKNDTVAELLALAGDLRRAFVQPMLSSSQREDLYATALHKAGISRKPLWDFTSWNKSKSALVGGIAATVAVATAVVVHEVRSHGQGQRAEVGKAAA